MLFMWHIILAKPSNDLEKNPRSGIANVILDPTYTIYYADFNQSLHNIFTKDVYKQVA